LVRVMEDYYQDYINDGWWYCSDGDGTEISTAPFYYSQLPHVFQTINDILSDANIDVYDDDCLHNSGIHVHVDVHDKTRHDLAEMLYNFTKIETKLIRKFGGILAERAGWCMSNASRLREYAPSYTFNKALTKRRLARLQQLEFEVGQIDDDIVKYFSDTRYYALNISNILQHYVNNDHKPTIEFRFLDTVGNWNLKTISSILRFGVRFAECNGDVAI